MLRDSAPCFDSFKIHQEFQDGRLCECQFGNPNSKTSLGTLFYFYMYYSIFLKKGKEFNQYRNLFLIIYILISLTIGMGELYLGHGYLDQIINGYIFSYILISVYLYIDKKQIIHLILGLPFSSRTEI